MVIAIILIGVLYGVFINEIIIKVSYNISKKKITNINISVPIITGIIFFISFLIFGLTIIFLKSIILGSVLLIVSVIDIRYKIIPDNIVILTLITGVVFSFIGDTSFYNCVLGMLLGGGLLFLLALIPNAMGGGDVKLMFAIGSFLGYTKTLWALILAFVLAALVSLTLLVLKIKKRKDYIPFGPFIALGTFISFLFLK